MQVHRPLNWALLAEVVRPLTRLAAVGLAALVLHTPDARAVAVPAAGTPAPVPSSKPQPTRVAQAPAPITRADTRPSWTELGSEQQKALQPLARSWPTLSEAQKRKWIALSRNFGSLAPQDQAKLHSRMNDWATLSPQQRAQARLNFGETKGLSADDKKAKWEAYQALPPEEKSKLAAGARGKTSPTAAAVRPVPAQKLATTPPRDTGRNNKPPRIAAGPAPETQPAFVAPANTPSRAQ